MPTYPLGAWLDKQIRLEADYDASNRLTTLRCVNNAAGHTLTVDIGRSAGTGRRYGTTFGAGTTTLVILTTTANRIIITPSTRGRFLGLDGQIEVI